MSNSDGSRAGGPRAGGNGAMASLEQILRGRRILLTGSTGFLGKVFLYLLLRWHPEIEKVYLLIRGDSRTSLNRFRREILDSPVMAPLREHLGARFDRYLEDKITVVPGDIANDGLLAAGAPALRRGSIDAVVHGAGLVNFEASLAKAIEVNTTGVANVVEFCRRIGAKLIHVSTCYVAGSADGQRYEDDVPDDWCPADRRNFEVAREVRDALAAIARVEAQSRDQVTLAELRAAAGDDGGELDGRESALEHRRKQWVEERLKEIGKARALSWGWPNTYSYTKSLGEQLVLAARRLVDATVVRPAVIESALADPFPGWNQGVNTSAPLTYLSGRGYRFYPARADLVLDVIPVDLVAHAMIPILAALLAERHRPIYQLCTSDRNPLPMRRLVELTALSNRREHRRGGNGAVGRFANHLESVVVSQASYDLASRTLPAMLKRAMEMARSLSAADSPRMRGLEGRLDSLLETADLARDLIEVYRPYIQELAYTFHGSNIRALYARLRPADTTRHPYAPETIDWRDYWINVHLPGLRRHIFPQLDLHARGRPRSLPRHRTLLDLLDGAAERYAAAPALIGRQPSGESAVTTYRELRDRARRAALLLARRGIEAGDRVLLIAENSPDWALAFFSIICAGAVAVPLDHLISAEELAPICKIAEPRAVLRSAAVATRLQASIAGATGGAVEIDLAELRRPFVLNRRIAAPPAPERRTLASIVFTSGTTGASKGVMLTHGNFTAEVAMISRVFALGADDNLLSLLPLHHTFEFTCGMLLPLASGASITYPLEVDAKTLARTLADVRPTALIGVPALWEAIHRRIIDEVEARGPFFAAGFGQLRDLNRRLERDSGVNLGSILFRQAHAALGGNLRLAVSGGAALPRRVAEFFNDIGIRLLEGYGLTEAAPVLSAAHPDESLCPGSVGKPLGRIELRLDPDGAEVGEIVARGPNVMAGYYRNRAATDEVLRDGWLRTGDLGRFDSDGRLYIVGRAKEVIVDSGGNNIYIEELEEAYGHSPYVKELAVVGLKVGGGEQVAALAVPAYARGESRRAVEDRLRAHFDAVARGLSPHKRIRILRFTDHDLPRTRTRKIKRNEVVAIVRQMLDTPTSGANDPAAANREVAPWIAQALAWVAPELVAITPATRLIEDLGLDSLAMAELGEHLAEHAGREISPDEMSDLRTVADLERAASEVNGAARVRMPSYARFSEPFTPRLPRPLRSLARATLRRTERAVFDTWLRPKILGHGNIPANRNVLVVANHASHIDFGLVEYALGAMGRDLVVLAAKDYFFNTAARRFIATNFTTLIPFDRERAQLESLDDALAELAAGRSVLMFPEGTRSPDGEVHDFKSGGGYLALRSGCDVLPIHIRGTYDVLGKGSLMPRRHPVEVRIGRVIAAERMRAIATDSEGMGAYRKVAEHLRATILALAGPRPRVGGPARARIAKAAAPPLHDSDGGPQRAGTQNHRRRAKL
jgi:long-chain acyl-CoA synthetase